MRVGSLFSGIGGLDLGLERAGMTVVWQSEIDPYASRVLAKHWPHVPNLGDITTIDWSTVEPVDLIAGGYPCQPFSLAGSRAGSDDARHLWPYFADALRELRPRFALLENVPGHLSMGFGSVLSDLADLGYDTDWDCIPAAAVGAPHLRYRVFIVAHTSSPRRRQDPRGSSGDEGADEGRTSHGDHIVDGDGQGRRAAHVAHPHGEGEPGEPVDAFARRRVMVPRDVADTSRVNGSRSLGIGDRAGRPEGQTRNSSDGQTVADTDREAGDASRATGKAALRPATIERSRRRGSSVPDADRQPTRRVAVPRRQRGQWAVEPDVGRVAHGVPSRVDRLKCLGNAVVPQVAEWVGHRIMEAAA